MYSWISKGLEDLFSSATYTLCVVVLVTREAILYDLFAAMQRALCHPFALLLDSYKYAFDSKPPISVFHVNLYSIFLASISLMIFLLFSCNISSSIVLCMQETPKEIVSEINIPRNGLLFDSGWTGQHKSRIPRLCR